MRKIISFMHISLDGLVAGPNGEMDWIHIDEEMTDYINERVTNISTALYGRRTYQMMESYWPTAAEQPEATRHDIEHAKWYCNAQKIVLSKTIKNTQPTSTTIISDSISDRIDEIKQSGNSDILLFGSPSVTHILHELNLIDGYWLFVNPIILGHGVPLFEGIDEKVKLKLIPLTRQFSSGVTELNYTVDRKQQ